MTIKLQRLTDSDAIYCDHRHGTPALVKSFNGYTEQHVMTIHQDNGQYRHLSFRNPDTNIAWFDLITWPNNLVITGDMGTFNYTTSSDMFAFFNQGYINPGYWMEKLKHSTHNGYENESAYCEESFKAWVLNDFWVRSRHLDHDESTRWWSELTNNVFAKDTCLGTEEDAVYALEFLDLPAGLQEHYNDLHESKSGWRRNWWNMEWCMAAILSGVRTYNQHKKCAVDELSAS